MNRSRTSRGLTTILLAMAACVASVLVGTEPASAATRGPTLFVATDGHRGADGTREDPIASINEAVDRLGHGGVVAIRGGVYPQRIKVRHVRGITIAPYGREHVVLDGTSLTPQKGRSAMVTIVDSSRIKVARLDIRDYRTKAIDAMPIGIYVHGASSHIALRRNHVHSMGNDNRTLGSFDLNAHGIAVYGDRAHHRIKDVRITGNEVDHLKLGASESVVVNGNVKGWRITENRIHDNNNIGIDAIGFEPTLKGAARYTRRNRARDGVIADNVVYNIISKGNPSYYEDGEWCNCADGIYVDGGTDISVRRNQVRGNDIGVEVAAENGRGSADHVIVADNVISRSGYVGIATGGYCNGADDCGGVKTGRAFANRFVNNTLWGNNRFDDGSPEILVQYYVYRSAFRNNILVATTDDHAVVGTVPGAQRDGLSTRNRFDGNIYFAKGGGRRSATFGSLGRTYTGFAAYRRATGLDRHSRFVNPRLRHPGRGDLHLRRGSPAIGTGLDVRRRVVGARDIDGDPRFQGRQIDVGADER